MVFLLQKLAHGTENIDELDHMVGYVWYCSNITLSRQENEG